MNPPGYELIEQLGRGAMGSVHLAQARNSQRLVALKVLHEHLADHEDLRKRFRREVSACIKLSHPAIIKVLDAGEMDGRPFYTMEYLEDAAPLNALLASEGALDFEIALDVMRALLDALAYCHSQGLLHRDLKPSNLMIGPADRVTVMDFGLVREMESTLLTTPGTLLGTPRYLSPEMVRGDSAATCGDLWSAGAVFYEMLTGRPPFVGTSLPDIMREILTTDPPSVSRVRPILPATLDPLVARFLEKDITKRYSTAEEAIAALDSWTLRHGVAAPEASSSMARLRRPMNLSSSGVHVRRTTRSTRALRSGSLRALRRNPFKHGIALALGLVCCVAIALALVTKTRSPAHDAPASARVTHRPPLPPEAPVADRGARLRLRLTRLDPLGQLHALAQDLVALRGRHHGPPAITDTLRKAWQARLEDALTAAAVRDAVGEFRPVRDAYYASPDVPAAEKIALYGLVQNLIELEDGIQQLKLRVPLGAHRLESAEYGPLTTSVASPLSGTFIELDPTIDARSALNVSRDSATEPAASGHGRLRSAIDLRLANRDEVAMALLTEPWYIHPRPIQPLGPGAVEVRTVLDRLDPPTGIRLMVGEPGAGPSSPWRLLLHLHPLGRKRHVVRHRVPAGVFPRAPFAFRFEIAYTSMRTLTGGEPEQTGSVIGVAFGR